MKHTRRFLAMLLALVLTLGLCVTAFAEATGAESGTSADLTGSITIKRTDTDDKTVELKYTLYRIFDIESYNRTEELYSYKINDAWTDFFAAGQDGAAFVTTLEDGFVTWKSGSNAADFAAKAIAYAQGINIPNVATGTIASGADSVKIDKLALGYYLIDSSLGALCALTPTTLDQVVIEKNGQPTVTKEVKEGPDYGATNDAGVGDTVEFKITIQVTEGVEGYVLHDKMLYGLSLNPESIVVWKNNQVMTDGRTVKTANLGDNCAFEIKFESSAIAKNDKIEVTYSATITAEAVQNNYATNESWLEYGTDHETVHDETKTYTWELDILKYTRNGETETPLAGAEFILYKEVKSGEGETETTVTKYATVENGALRGWVDAEADATKLVSSADDSTKGQIIVKGLDAGDYILKEVKAPAGYNKLKDVIKIKIDSTQDENEVRTKSVQYGETTLAPVGTDGNVKVLNQTGATLPSTGGIGTTIFYVLGSVMALGAGILLVTKKRMAAE